MIVTRQPFVHRGRDYRPGDMLKGFVAHVALRDGHAINLTGRDVIVIRPQRREGNEK